MLKKVTIAWAVAMVSLFLAGVILLPSAARDLYRDREKIIGQFITSTPISTFDGNDYTTVHLDVGNAEIYLEPSADNQIYVKAEGVFSQQYTLASASRSENEQNILDIWLDTSEAFNSSSYLLWKGIFESNINAVVMRVPANVSVTTAGDPWRIRYSGRTRFANREYYDRRGWDEGYEEVRRADLAANQMTRRMLEKYEAQRTAFSSELEAAVMRQYSNTSPSMQAVGAEIDGIVSAYFERMSQQFFLFESPVYDRETLDTLLLYSLRVTGEEFRERARLDLSFDNDHEKYNNMRQMAAKAEVSFRELYEKYLDSASFHKDSLDDDPDENALDSQDHAMIDDIMTE